MLKGRLLSLTGLLPCEHQSSAQGSVWDYKCYWHLSKCVFSSHLKLQSVSEIMMLLIQVFCCYWNSAGQAQGCWGKCCSHSSALRKSDPKWAVAATRMRAMARTPYFQNIFLWQKTEKGFHSVKMAMSLLVTPAERPGALMGVHFLLCMLVFHQHLFFCPLWIWRTND